MAVINILTYNMHGYNQGETMIKTLCEVLFFCRNTGLALTVFMNCALSAAITSLLVFLP